MYECDTRSTSITEQREHMTFRLLLNILSVKHFMYGVIQVSDTAKISQQYNWNWKLRDEQSSLLRKRWTTLLLNRGSGIIVILQTILVITTYPSLCEFNRECCQPYNSKTIWLHAVLHEYIKISEEKNCFLIGLYLVLLTPYGTWRKWGSRFRPTAR